MEDLFAKVSSSERTRLRENDSIVDEGWRIKNL